MRVKQLGGDGREGGSPDRAIAKTQDDPLFRHREKAARRSPDIASGDPIGVQTREERAFDRRILESLRVEHPSASMSALKRWWTSLTEEARESHRRASGEEAKSGDA